MHGRYRLDLGLVPHAVIYFTFSTSAQCCHSLITIVIDIAIDREFRICEKVFPVQCSVMTSVIFCYLFASAKFWVLS